MVLLVLGVDDLVQALALGLGPDVGAQAAVKGGNPPFSPVDLGIVGLRGRVFLILSMFMLHGIPLLMVD
jgi:hypothetical protein